MSFTSKSRTRARIVAAAVLMSGTLPNLAFAAYSLSGSPHAPFLTRMLSDKVQAARPTNGIAADRPVAGTQSDVAAAAFPVVTPGRSPSRVSTIVGRHHGGPLN